MKFTLRENAINIQTDTGETFYYNHRYLQTDRLTVRTIPPFWSQCPIGRLIHGVYNLSHSAQGQPELTTLTGPWAKGNFQTLTLAPNQTAVVSLKHLAGFLINDENHGNRGIIMRPILRALLSPAAWIMGHPVPCVFEGPVTIVFYGQSLAWDDSPDLKTFKPRQVLCFDPSRPFGVTPTIAARNPTSILYNSLTLESRFISYQGSVLYENIQHGSSNTWHRLKHFILHILTFSLWLLLYWLYR